MTATANAIPQSLLCWVYIAIYFFSKCKSNCKHRIVKLCMDIEMVTFCFHVKASNPILGQSSVEYQHYCLFLWVSINSDIFATQVPSHNFFLLWTSTIPWVCMALLHGETLEKTGFLSGINYTVPIMATKKFTKTSNKENIQNGYKKSCL